MVLKSSTTFQDNLRYVYNTKSFAENMIKFRDHSKLIMHLISMNNCGRNSEYENTSDEVSIVVDRGLNSSENEEKTFDDFIVFQCGKEQFFIRL